jgi:hypothetical protein
MDSQDFNRKTELLYQRIRHLKYRVKQITLCARMAQTNVSGLEDLQVVLDAIEQRMQTLETQSAH